MQIVSNEHWISEKMIRNNLLLFYINRVAQLEESLQQASGETELCMYTRKCNLKKISACVLCIKFEEEF